VRHEDGHDVQRSEQLNQLIERESLSFESTDRIVHTTRLRTLRIILEIRATPTDTMNLLGEIDGLKPTREGSLEIPSERGCAAGDARFEFGIGRHVTATSRDGERAVALNGLEKLDPTLIAQHLTDQCSEHVDIVTQRRVLGRELDVDAAHGGMLHRQRILKRKGRKGNPSGLVRLHAVNGVE
jgi:hypothetical protein